MLTRSRGFMVGMAMFLAVSGLAWAEDPGEILTRGKLELDTGRTQTAIDAFAQVAEDPAATDEQRWEALIRLAVARRDAGSLVGSATAFEEAWKAYRESSEAVRFLLASLGSALPDSNRWDEVWRDVKIETDRSVPSRPEVRVLWPGIPHDARPAARLQRVSVDFKDTHYFEVFRAIADMSGLNVVVIPGVTGVITYQAHEVPLDKVVEEVLAPYGYVAEFRGNVVMIGRPGKKADDAFRQVTTQVRDLDRLRDPADPSGTRAFTGTPISIDYQDRDLVEVLGAIAAHGKVRVEAAEGIAGRVTIKLSHVPWDQALDLLCVMNGISWRQQADVIRVEPRPTPREN